MLKKFDGQTSAVMGLLLSNYVVFGVRTIAGMVVAGILGPEKRGVWSALALVLSYGIFVSLGAVHAMGRQIPILLGRGDLDAIRRFKNTSVTFILVSHCLVGFALASYAYFLKPFDEVENRGLVFIGGLIPVSGLIDYCLTVFRAEQKFKVYSVMAIIEAVSHSALMILGAWYLSLDGVYIAVAVSWALVLGICIRLELINVRLTLSWPTLWEVLRHGLPLGMISYAYVLYQSIDRLVILGNINTRALGLYTIGVMLYQALMVLPNSILQFIAPKALHGFGRAGAEAGALARFVNDPLYVQSSLMAVVVPCGMVALNLLLRWFLPAYQEGYLAGMIVCIASISAILPNAMNIVLSAEAHFFRYMAMMGASLGLNFLCATVMVKAGFGMEGVAVSTVLTFTLYGVAVGTYVPRRYFGEPWPKIITRLARFFWPLPVCAGVVLADRSFGFAGLAGAAALSSAVGVLAALRPLKRLLESRRIQQPPSDQTQQGAL